MTHRFDVDIDQIFDLSRSKLIKFFYIKEILLVYAIPTLLTSMLRSRLFILL